MLSAKDENMSTVRGTVLDPVNRRRFPGEVAIRGGRVAAVRETSGDAPSRFILPGFVDAHVHIESSMLVPAEFARIALRHGTVATVSDPHEIANVCGVEGIDFMIRNGRDAPLKFAFGAPSCVPATPFETSGAKLDPEAVGKLLDREDIPFLGEMMNWPGVLEGDAEVMAKIRAALDRGKPVDGHAPGLVGEQAARYIAAGISTDHECASLEEALDKLERGMRVLIREGSAARDFDELIPALEKYPGRVMFCSDDKHPDDLQHGHINALAARALGRGLDLWDILEACSVTPVRHYGLDVGLLQEGDPADFVVVADTQKMEVEQTWIDGECVQEGGGVFFRRGPVNPVNNFVPHSPDPADFRVLWEGESFPVIEASEGSLLTGKSWVRLPREDGELLPSPGEGINKIAVVCRYRRADPAAGFVRGFGLREGAIASSVAHDSHNIVAVGATDAALAGAVDLVMRHRGGIAAVLGDREEVLPLPVAGLMSDRPGEEVSAAHERLTRRARERGSPLSAPHMVLSFMALLVIPSLRIGDRGIFDAERFEFLT
jgi:adenine deaminase